MCSCMAPARCAPTWPTTAMPDPVVVEGSPGAGPVSAAPATTADLADAANLLNARPTRVLVVGAGLMGTSVGLALRRHGLQVWLSDRSDRHVDLAERIGAGIRAPEFGAAGDAGGGPAAQDPAADGLDPDLVVVGVPPDAAGAAVAVALHRFPGAVVTDLASVKAPVICQVVDLVGPADLVRYVPGHPMAGSERSGPLAARRDLFLGRAWAIVSDLDPVATTGPGVAALARVRALVALCDATPVELTAAEHDAAVALVSHLPHVAAVAVAGLLSDAPAPYLALAGQGVRDVTRIAAGDPLLWQQILASNAGVLGGYIRAAARGLTDLADELDAGTPLAARLARGVSGVRRLPGKHGGLAEDFVAVDVVVPDRPGELARLFGDVTSAGVNIEDIRIDHNLASAEGIVALSVRPAAEPDLADALSRHGWSVAG